MLCLPRRHALAGGALLLVLAALAAAGWARWQRAAQSAAAPAQAAAPTLSTQPAPALEPSVAETNPAQLMTLGRAGDVAARRAELIHYLWKGRGLPTRSPDVVHRGIADQRYDDLPNLARKDLLVVRMDSGFTAYVYHFVPRRPRPALLLYHQGHEYDLPGEKRVLSFFLRRGYPVLSFAMPLYGMNSQPTVHLRRFGNIRLESHEQFKLLRSEELEPIRFFLEPLAVALNHVLAPGRKELVAMVGLSGGGWATTLYAAIDPRVRRSYPVAGSLPIYLRGEKDWGDDEQTAPELYRIANYLELYLLGAHGSGRAQLQVLNQYDECCFAGVKHRLYEPAVRELLEKLGEGSFRVHLDTTHRRHQISDSVLELIAEDVRRHEADGQASRRSAPGQDSLASRGGGA